MASLRLTRAERADLRQFVHVEVSPKKQSLALLCDRVETKIFDTLHKIRSKDPAIYDKGKVFFDDADFQESKDAAKKSAGSSEKKGMKYKDFLRETLMKEGADAIVKEEERLEKKAQKAKGKMKTPEEEQKDLRAEILSAAKGLDEDAQSDDDLFTIKVKTPKEKEQEEAELDSFAKRMKTDSKGDADDIMTRYWKADEDLDDSECFLRDFILNEEWKETTSIQASSSRAGAKDHGSEDEEEHLEDADEFEKEYNFRFEVEEGQQIQSYSRFQESSVRQRPDKRKRQRAAKADRKESEKIRRTEELKRLKNLKKQEIRRRLEQIKEVTGNEDRAPPDGHGALESKL
ncbi:unnamed protein product [Prorocentrum cordatum]|uniref:Protein KRI1 homolog n=1 Tax=Prorocentrum cordatum TaxID=2364126 RepID=A0ABN9Y5P2_9DINO|nr:unnamed protein product [Polarella glacialis]